MVEENVRTPVTGAHALQYNSCIILSIIQNPFSLQYFLCSVIQLCRAKSCGYQVFVWTPRKREEKKALFILPVEFIPRVDDNCEFVMHTLVLCQVNYVLVRPVKSSTNALQNLIFTNPEI